MGVIRKCNSTHGGFDNGQGVGVARLADPSQIHRGKFVSKRDPGRFVSPIVTIIYSAAVFRANRSNSPIHVAREHATRKPAITFERNRIYGGRTHKQFPLRPLLSLPFSLCLAFAKLRESRFESGYVISISFPSSSDTAADTYVRVASDSGNA